MKNRIKYLSYEVVDPVVTARMEAEAELERELKMFSWDADTASDCFLDMVSTYKED